MSKATKKDVSETEKTTKAKPKEKKEKEASKNPIQEFTQFSKDSWTEFKKIQWPTRKQALNESIVVLVTVVFIILLVKGYDLFSGWLLHFIFQK
ncbi:preprotein translocase subunit SecE [bacterium (Candidatus Blackallbacteria) CG17_big_fil_post_rev_8_21_14_2_50_48_46]|uniref:Protein translocase subunit SecE n=1 Tax=bacterium (Candidatus Blackallbacteria) CG17_big_fil_post_rev_8_21_14_2_50_48_46 TaxID=2014261 RepID=A0A2M7G5V1_9BACT|nr:MAG: preprotein translocase subunit SecE [bacterium (Candidatus Blackallbacteria) CG18_big_fil_WC_8_21_14_2_50_49_26]PIW16962.1 MAG: preprotein translocase subunit SecE [bacterium (Candidatus Blackallbacteria) CG17_big_fil_post_rev_8_21_14_2_50_48_46]PIW50241.1 MAG: preprotein translocase subunit SecE [bacterium (Candidatus Blackallbacteria) CG13_big_fil_rev_8_21_14_2_50_49_14]